MKLLITSDTHGKLPSILEHDQFDLFVHCGDICGNTQWDWKADWLYQKEWLKETFSKWIAQINARHKLILCGNHDGIAFKEHYNLNKIIEDMGAMYLQDRTLEIDSEIIYGNGYSYCPPELGIERWALGYVGENPYANKIPTNCTLLFTHEPPYGIMDKLRRNGKNIGSKSLCNTALSLPNLKLHVFGHAHIKDLNIPQTELKIGNTLFINASNQFLEVTI
jgi:Icc-related predicted phosphoesterase